MTWEIRAADNIDKHNLIVPTITVTSIRNAILVDDMNKNIVTIGEMSVSDGGELLILGYQNRGHLKFASNGQASLSITFPDGCEVFAGKPVFPTLLECSQLTSETLSLIEGWCSA